MQLYKILENVSGSKDSGDTTSEGTLTVFPAISSLS